MEDNPNYFEITDSDGDTLEFVESEDPRFVMVRADSEYDNVILKLDLERLRKLKVAVLHWERILEANQ